MESKYSKEGTASIAVESIGIVNSIIGRPSLSRPPGMQAIRPWRHVTFKRFSIACN